MSKKIDLTVIDQLFAAQLSMNESEERIAALRPQVEAAVQMEWEMTHHMEE